MLHEFLTANRAELIERCRVKVAQRPAPGTSEAELEHGVSRFLDQLVKTLRMERGREPLRSREVSGASGGVKGGLTEMGRSATQHGGELLRRGFTVDQVVHDYGDVCQSITDLAVERDEAIAIDEFRTLNRCLDNAIAEAVTEFSYQREVLIVDKTVQALNERLGFLAHELRNHLQTATLALAAVRAGNVGISGATGSILSHSLVRLRTLIDRSLADVRVTAGMPARHEVFSLADFIAEVQISASLEALTRDCTFTVARVDPRLAVDADRDLLFSALGNVLQNAFKFTHRHSEVTLNAFASADRILIDVEDHCGGLPSGDTEHMFLPFMQSGADKSGIGLGLSISRRSVEANDGTLSVRDRPGTGCVFTIDLPRHELAKAPITR
ncbi:MAG TPA: HAMP domain-containing sensor histidine kinase [Burkholderiales bacterium]|nr:HAMP domain-containing sensor histidine kinase [Burkholderiales bacterium]